MDKKTRRRLLDLGIPENRHDAASLAALFPSEFRVGDARLGAAEIAKVYLTFVDHGLLNSPKRPEALPARCSTHVVHFYRSERESTSFSAAYLHEGLNAGDRALWILPAWLTAERAREAMRAVRPAVYEAESAGRLTFVADHRVHVDETGAMRDARGIIAYWLEQERLSLAGGFRALRIAGDGTALIRGDDWKRGVEYEHDCDEAFHGRRIYALCSYAADEIPAPRLAEVLGAHAVGVARVGEGRETRANAILSPISVPAATRGRTAPGDASPTGEG